MNSIQFTDDEMATLQIGLLLSNQDMMKPERAHKLKNLIDRMMNYQSPDVAIAEAGLSVRMYYYGKMLSDTSNLVTTQQERQLQPSLFQKE